MSSPYRRKNDATAWRAGRIGWKEIKLIHTAVKSLGISDQEYRRILKDVAGVASSKDLSHAQCDALIRRFQADGFVPTANPRKRETWNAGPAAGCDKADLLRKIAAILGDIGKEWNYANGIARQMWRVDACSWCLPEQLHSIVAALEYKRNQILDREPKQSLKRELKGGLKVT